MIRQMSLFSQLLNVFSRPAFIGLVRKHQTERCAKGFSSWSHFVAMLFCQLAQAESLREICDGLRCCLGKLVHIGMKDGPRRSTLAYANQHRSWELFQDLFFEMLQRCQEVAPQKKFRFKNKLLSLDATVIDLCLNLFPWAKFRQTKGAVKLHLLLDHDGYLPTYAWIREAAVHEINIARLLELPADSVLALDMGYVDYRLYSAWTSRKIWLVTRTRCNVRYRVVERRRRCNGGVFWRMTSSPGRTSMPTRTAHSTCAGSWSGTRSKKKRSFCLPTIWILPPPPSLPSTRTAGRSRSSSRPSNRTSRSRRSWAPAKTP